jgi:hypothetical protein
MAAIFHKIDKDSQNAITNALELFDVPSTNVSVSSSATTELLSLNPVQYPPIRFKIHSSTGYIDLSKIYVFTEFRILNQNPAREWVDITVANNVSVCQMLGSTYWKNARMFINGVQVYEGNALQSYKSYLSHELTYNLDAKRTYLSVAGYYPDGDSQTAGDGYDSRRALFWSNNTARRAQFMAKLDIDLCHQARYLVNQTEVEIELQPQDHNFCIVSPTAGDDNHYRLELLSCKLYVKKVELMDSLAFDLSRKLEQHPARYPLRKTALKQFHITEHRTEYYANLWSDHVPRRLILGLLSNDDFTGTKTTSPFNFKPFNMKEISVIANGVQYPLAPYTLDFPNKKFSRLYHDTQQAIGYDGSLESNGISLKKFGEGGSCIFVFNLTASGEESGPDTVDLIRNGSTDVKIHFGEQVQDRGLILIAMAEFDSLLMIDRNRTISTDMTVY